MTKEVYDDENETLTSYKLQDRWPLHFTRAAKTRMPRPR
jgi:hypothetical protein